jgi:hypothetical protein
MKPSLEKLSQGTLHSSTLRGRGAIFNNGKESTHIEMYFSMHDLLPV